jgi:hypothetical protein
MKALAQVLCNAIIICNDYHLPWYKPGDKREASVMVNVKITSAAAKGGITVIAIAAALIIRIIRFIAFTF